jgi:ATP/maltotriose-dependent transcriptional regulator MalT/DNA-binding SARP family transcriptional activator
LDGLLSEVQRRRLTVVVAGPGFGKSTLTASWAAQGNVAWYCLGPEDCRMSTLARGVVDAVRLRVPMLSTELVGVLSAGGAGAAGEDEEIARAEALAQFMAQALEANLPRELVLVLDGLDEVGVSPSTGQLIDSLCRMAPPTFHLVVSSRVELPFPIERLRGRGQVLELGGADLAFSEAEVTELFGRLTDDEDPATAAMLHDLTGGWPAAVRLAIESLRGVPLSHRRQALDRLRQPGGTLYRYLAAEVLGSQPEEVRRLIATVARTGLAAPALCETLGLTGAADILRSLAKRGLFVEGHGQRLDWFSLSPLVRETALMELPLDEAAARDVDLRTCEWLEQHGHSAEAVRLCRDRADWEGAVRLLERWGSRLVRAGEASDVVATLTCIPVGLRTPALEFVAGEASAVVGDWDGALACYERAALASAVTPPALAWRIVRMHYFHSDLDKALEDFQEADAGEDSTATLRDRALLFAWRSSARWLRGDEEGCRKDGARAFELATASGDPEALSCAHTALAMLAALEGDRAANDAHYLRALDYAVQAGDVLQQVRVRNNRGSLYLEQGFYEEAIAELDVALRSADLAGFASFRALALVNRGAAQYRLGRFEEAVDDLEAARRQYERMGSSDAAYALVNLARIYRERGDLAMARAAFEEAIAGTEEVEDVQALVPALAGLAVVLATDDPERAERLADRAVAYGPGMDHAEALVSAGWVALANGRTGDATRCAAEAATAAASRRDRLSLAQALELAAVADPSSSGTLAKIEEAISLWSDLRSVTGKARAELLAALLTRNPAGVESAEAELRRLGVRSHHSLVRHLATAGFDARMSGADHAGVAVHTLGRLRVLVDGTPVPASAWQSRKARDLLKILVALRGRPVPREEMMELLWPGEQPEKLANRFAVALSTLRSALDPGKRSSKAPFVVSDRDAVRLDTGRVSVDVEGFLADAADGLARSRRGDAKAVEVLDRAESVYTGDFLEENAYDDWAVALREAARASYLQVCRALAEAAVARNDGEVATKYLRRLIERDPYDEPAHLELVRVLLESGHHGEAHRSYRAYSGRMREIGMEPSPFLAMRA